jgi:hypothetical protein
MALFIFDMMQSRGSRLAPLAEELQQGLRRPLLANPQQPLGLLVDLIHQESRFAQRARNHG